LVPAAKKLFQSLHSLDLRLAAIQGMSPNDVALYFGMLSIQMNPFPEHRQVSGYLMPFDTAYFPKTVSGIASDKDGIDIVQLPPKAVVSQEDVSQKQHGARFLLTVGITPPGIDTFCLPECAFRR
jgi:hypothetical protein